MQMNDATTITTRHSNTTSAGKHEYESPDNPSAQAICASYLHPAAFGDNPSDYLNVTLYADEPTATLSLDRTTKNYAIYETPNGAVTGMYVSPVSIGDGLDSTDDAPESIPVRFEPATEDAWEEESVDEEMLDEAGGLLADSGDEATAESDDSDEAELVADD